MRPGIVQFELDALPAEGFKNLQQHIDMLERRLMVAEIHEWCANAPDDWLMEAEQQAATGKAGKPRLRDSRIADISAFAADSWENAMAMHKWIQRFHGA